jgi:hypothetical protein
MPQFAAGSGEEGEEVDGRPGAREQWFMGGASLHLMGTQTRGDDGPWPAPHHPV